MVLDPTEFDTMSPEEFARTVKQTPDKEIVETMRGDLRVPILDAVFARFPGLFRPDKAKATKGVVQFRITDGPGDPPFDVYEIVVDDGTCTVSETPGDTYDASLMMAPLEFLKMATGRGNPTMLVMRGKIKVKGDLALAASFPTLFDIPKG